ncbi:MULTISPECIES: Zn-dependent hydrolase [Rhizobium]|uniref:N-carbamoyl-L-amino acid hydrolase 1 n=1 Tax=Rhizobium phaseoli TaxID=396 RepID=A0A192T8R6_9HYPH|nr:MULTISPECIES: Zn-dependent hydrolase [Rhizobium]ANL40618.1 N-carbamoyl-L-amino acid hydrolase 1 [Rhizobium phaseoli]ANL53353.1 N-carbamoyl-L-amino acid hydrolase 1 [Rhizobium phaseoli]ANL59606.1 N-carbamoyl-L-amino acid hydrolase 1 [Rhizobium phaseoli]ANL85000.1 N-carbamoyl-L-amino acid hydrolase 1 [Rhizobium phaseoli]ANL91508.1 N-carbamoyl-L-amino acid hydrolase 1 [Rhizobium phaseoli]
MSEISINAERLLGRILELGDVGREDDGRLIRLAASDTEKLGRDKFVSWIERAGLEVAVDRIGNIFGIWKPAAVSNEAPLMLGSHIDTVINAGIYDGCYGVLSGLEVIETLVAAGFQPSRPIVVAAFTNEEGVRYAPDMMGSLVYAGGLDVDTALATVGTDGTKLGEELRRIGYDGEHQPGFIRPHAYIELHIEQGPVLEREGIQIGAVENLQGISWQRVTISGDANHAGTTPISMRRDAGHAAALVITFLRERARNSNTPTVATVGCMTFEPNAINVIPSRATFTVDLRDPDEERLRQEEAALEAYLAQLAKEEGVSFEVERLARFQPVWFDGRIVDLIAKAAARRGHTVRRMTSGAGHDAQMITRIAPAAMIFVPSLGGISHNPKEKTPDEDLVAGANMLLDVAKQIAGGGI